MSDRMSARTPLKDLPPQTQAGIVCNNPQFQDFAAYRSGFPANHFNESAAAEYLRQFCEIDSRREFETNERARLKLDVLITEFDAWRGVQPTPRGFQP